MDPIRRTLSATVFGLALAAASLPAAAGQWPQWRGPDGDGTSDATGLATGWDASTNVQWRLPLPGPGPSTPVLWGDRIFLTAAEGDDLVLMAISTEGKALWTRRLGDGNRVIRSGESNMAAPSPVTDGKHVWVLLGTGHLASFDFSGNEVWNINLQERYEPFSMYHGYSSSPLLDGDRIFVQALHSNQQLVLALDRRTGVEVWKHIRTTDARAECLHSYASPTLYRDGGKELLLIQGADYLTAHRPADGKEVWRVGGLQDAGSYNPMFRLVATPASAASLIVVPSAKNGPILGLDPSGAAGDITGVKKHLAWRLDHGTPDVPSPVIHDGLVYLSRENGVVICLDAKTGKVLYEERPSRARHRGSPLLADGKLYLMGMDGTVTVLRAGRTYEVLAQNTLDEQVAASLAVAGDTLYLRTYEALYAIRGN
jgi:outer membrane protein assembly factor BamB